MHKVVLESFEFAGGHRLILGRLSSSLFNARDLYWSRRTKLIAKYLVSEWNEAKRKLGVVVLNLWLASGLEHTTIAFPYRFMCKIHLHRTDLHGFDSENNFSIPSTA